MRSLLVTSSLLALSACMPGREYIRGSGASGPNVFVNGAPARSGTYLYSGDRVTSGPGSSALVIFQDGGFFQLDADTDPIFVIKYLQSARCILVQIFSGQAFMDEANFCLETPAAEIVAHSVVNVRTTARDSAITLIAGAAEVVRPQAAPLHPNQQAVAKAGDPVVRVRALTPAAVAAIVSWRNAYRFEGYCDEGLAGTQRAAFNECLRGRFRFNPPPGSPVRSFPERPPRPPRREPG